MKNLVVGRGQRIYIALFSKIGYQLQDYASQSVCLWVGLGRISPSHVGIESTKRTQPPVADVYSGSSPAVAVWLRYVAERKRGDLLWLIKR